MSFWTRFQPRTTATIYLKSGAVLTIKCRNFKIKYDGDQMTSYEIDGMNKDKLLYLRITDVSAITYK